MITKKETPLSVSAALATVTAPTVPTAPLPSELQAALNYLCENGTFSERKSARTIREHLLTMQRERDEAREQRQEFSQRLHRTAQILVEEFGADRPSNADEVAQCAVERHGELKEQLAASERTCAELRERLERCNEMRERQFTRAEAAERTVEGLRGKP